jgi:hypothetical protein
MRQSVAKRLLKEELRLKALLTSICKRVRYLGDCPMYYSGIIIFSCEFIPRIMVSVHVWNEYIVFCKIAGLHGAT